VADEAKKGGTIVQNRLVVAVFAAVAACLALAYFAFLRTSYVPLYRDLRPADAAVIVTELDRRGIPYALRDEGATILVAEHESDEVRLAIAGSELPLGGLVGFELFNESDLGLTDFTQKINYQRALQGELSRTIMMMDGVASARVHLAIPERSLFRGNRSETRAAVAVVARRGGSLDEARVAGIQRLVASSVPELALANVVVLDGLGRVISSALAADANQPPEMEERAGVQQYYRARIRAALEPLIPSHRFDVRVAVLSPMDEAAPAAPAATAPAPAAAASVVEAPSNGDARRQFRLRVTILTSEAVAADQQAVVANAVRSAADLDEQAGDRLLFAVGPVDLAPVPVAPRSVAAAPGPAMRSQSADLGPWSWLNIWALLAIACVAATLLLLVRARRGGLTAQEQVSFAERLRAQLALEAEQRSA
jgi:flagellar M-ring protein FliF